MRSTPIGASIEALYATGHWLHSLGRHRDAAVVFRVMAKAEPSDERAWIALGACHEASGHVDIALALYGYGRLAAAPSARCEIARVRLLRGAGQDALADEALDRAEGIADALNDDTLKTLVVKERRGS